MTSFSYPSYVLKALAVAAAFQPAPPARAGRVARLVPDNSPADNCASTATSGENSNLQS